MKKVLFLWTVLIVVTSMQAQLSPGLHDNKIHNTGKWTLLVKEDKGDNWSRTSTFEEIRTMDSKIGKHINVIYLFDSNTYNFLYNQEHWLISVPIFVHKVETVVYGDKPPVKLIIKANALFTESMKLRVFASSSPDYRDIAGTFTEVGIINVGGNPTSTDLPTSLEFPKFEIDLTDFITTHPTSSLYIALRHDTTLPFGEIDSITSNAIASATSSNDFEKDSMAVYLKQNPIEDNLQFVGSFNIRGAMTIQVYNSNGALVLDTICNSSPIDVSHLSTGVYIAKITNGAVEKNIKFIKK